MLRAVVFTGIFSGESEEGHRVRPWSFPESRLGLLPLSTPPQMPRPTELSIPLELVSGSASLTRWN